MGLALLTTAACGRARRVFVSSPGPSPASVVRMGAYASLTGVDAPIGRALHEGFSTAVEQWNANADSNGGLRVELVVYDDQSRASGAAAAVRRLVADDHVALVVGGWNTERAQLAAAGTNALVVCPGCAAGDEPGVIGLAPSFHARAELLADLVVRTMNMSRVAILVRKDAALDRAAAEAFRASLKARSVETADALAFTPETIADVLARLVADSPQAVLVASDGNEAALVGRAMRRRGVPSALLFFGTPNIEVLPEADRVAALEGALFPGVFALGRTDEVGTRFVSAFQTAHGSPPNERAFLGYAAGRQVIEALAASSSAPSTELSEALRRTKSVARLEIFRVEHGTPVPALATNN